MLIGRILDYPAHLFPILAIGLKTGLLVEMRSGREGEREVYTN